MPGNAAVKSTARAALKGLWLSAIACTLLLLSAVFVAVYAASVFATAFAAVGEIIASVFVALFLCLCIAPLFLGVVRFFWRATADGDKNILSVFYYFESAPRYIGSLKFIIALLIRLALIALAVFSPYIAVEALCAIPSDILSEQIRMHLSFTSSVFASLGVLFFILFSVRFYLSPVLYVACGELDRHEILYLSKTVSRRSAGAYLVLIVGMVGWILLSALGVTLIYTVPYMLVSYVIHCRFAINYHNRKTRQAEQTDFPEFTSDF